MKHEQGEGGRGHQCAKTCKFRDEKFFKAMDGPASERVRVEHERVKKWHEEHGIEHERGGCR